MLIDQIYLTDRDREILREASEVLRNPNLCEEQRRMYLSGWLDGLSGRVPAHTDNIDRFQDG